MEEKKLTDEEIVQAFETCKNGRMLCQECPCFIKDVPCICSSENDIDTVLDLIHRLQGEIERLTEENRVVNHNMDFHRNKKIELQKQVDELKVENGRLHKIIVEEMVSVKAVRAAKSCPTAMKMLAESVGCVQKDTAKEIFETIFYDCWAIKDENGHKIFDEGKMKDFAEKCYGVEVE